MKTVSRELAAGLASSLQDRVAGLEIGEERFVGFPCLEEVVDSAGKAKQLSIMVTYWLERMLPSAEFLCAIVREFDHRSRPVVRVMRTA